MAMSIRAWAAGHSDIRGQPENPDGTRKYYGRFNQGVVTINLVDVACSGRGTYRPVLGDS